jgi:hypothetical protein
MEASVREREKRWESKKKPTFLSLSFLIVCCYCCKCYTAVSPPPWKRCNIIPPSSSFTPPFCYVGGFRFFDATERIRARMQSHGLCCIPPLMAAPVSAAAVAYSIVIQSGRTEDAVL